MRRPYFQEHYRRLKRLFPTRRKLRVCFVPASRLRKEHGEPVYADWSEGHIRIADNLSEHDALHALVHEFAHHLSRRKRHGKQFWETHGRIYRALFGD